MVAVVLAASIYSAWIYFSSRDQQVAEIVPQLPNRISDIIKGKPGTEAAAFDQLKMCQGQWVEFLTGLALLDTGSNREQVIVENFRVKFRRLSDAEIRAYIRLDQPLDCAGSFKAEAAGIALFESMHGRDYNTLLGLPMLALVDMLHAAGINPLLTASGS